MIEYTMSPLFAHLLEVQELVRLWCQSSLHRDERPPAWLLDELTRATDALRVSKTEDAG
jgi:hypothetical protein